MDSVVDEVKQKIDIVDFIGSHIQLKKLGRNFKALCPFHSEKSASFVVSPERQLWHCFGGCHDGGDIIKFLMKYESVTFYEAITELAAKAGVKIQTNEVEDAEWKKKERLLKMNQLAGEYYEFLLQKSTFGQKARDYITTRKINDAIVKTFQLGYAPSSWNSLLTFLRKKNFRDDEMTEAGLIIRNDKGNHYDRFRGRLMFPIKDMRGNIIGFSARAMEKVDDGAKYINTPETPLYHKRESLFGIHLAKDAIRKEENVLLVEGEFDMISPYQHGITNIVAIKGSAVTKEQLALLKRFTSRVTLALDNDEAGEDAVKRAIDVAEIMDVEVNVVNFEKGKDPDEAVWADPVEFKKTIQKPRAIYDFLIETAVKKYPNNDGFSKKKIGDDVVPYIARIQNPIIQSHYSKKLAGILDVSDESIASLIKQDRFKSRSRQSFVPRRKDVVQQNREEVLQKYLVSKIFQNENPFELVQKILAIVSEEDFLIPALAKILLHLKEYQTTHSQFNLQQFVDEMPAELRTVFDEVYLFGSSDVDLDSNIEKIAIEIKKYSLKKRIADVLGGDNESVEREEELLKLTKSLKEVEKRAVTV